FYYGRATTAVYTRPLPAALPISVVADDGHSLRVVVIATNANGDGDPVASGPSGVITYGVPTSIAPRPTLSTSGPHVGVVLTARKMTRANAPTSDTYTWQICASAC